MKQYQLCCLLKIHHFDCKFGWATCTFCKKKKWFDPKLWKEYCRGEVSFDRMKRANFNFKENQL